MTAGKGVRSDAVRGRLPPRGGLGTGNAEAPAPAEEQTSWPAFLENPLFLPNPKHAESFIPENETINNSQILENIS